MWDELGNLAVIRDRSDLSRRLCLPPGDIRFEDDWLGQLFAKWDGLRTGGLLPKRTDFDPVELMGMSKGRVHIVDTSSSTPSGYRFRLWGSSIDHLGGDFTAKCLGDMPSTPMRGAAIEDYADTVETGYPVYQLVYAVENFLPRSYARLLLPVTGDGRQVSQLFVCINPRDVPEVSDGERPAVRWRPQLRVV
jgi:PAS domain